MASRMPRTPESIRQAMLIHIKKTMHHRRKRVCDLAEDINDLLILSGCEEIEAMVAQVIALFQMTTRLPGIEVQEIARKLLTELLTHGPDAPLGLSPPKEDA